MFKMLHLKKKKKERKEERKAHVDIIIKILMI